MSAPAAVGVDRPTLRIRGTAYPVLLPTIRDPRLHLAAIIVTLQILGQVAFDFRLSIAQILVSLVTAGVLEFGITFWRGRVLMWPASALLTGNGVAFVLRVPGTEHGDWWSMKGWWIFAGTSAVALLSKYVIRVRGNHVFNPSNFGLVLCFLLLGAERADPLALWWGPVSPALVLALVLIVVGGFLILRRLHLLEIAVGFWLAFAAGIGVLAASGHTMTAAWHVGPIEGAQFWWLLVSSPEILVFLFFMITDPKTTPSGRAGRRAYAVGVGLLATLLIAPQTTEFATKVAILAALALVCTARGLVELVGPARLSARRPLAALPRTAAAGAVLVGALAFGALVFAAGIPARPDARGAELAADGGPLPEIVVADGKGVAPVSSVGGADDRAECPRRSPHRVGGPAAARPRPRRSRGRRGLARLALGADPDARRRGDRGSLRRRPRGADAAPRRVPGAAERRRESPGDICRLDVRPDRGGTRVPRPGQIPEDSGARARRRDLPDRALGGRSPTRDVGGPAGERNARRNDVRRRRETGGARLPAGRIPLRRLERHDGDDGRRPLLARLRPRRPARSLRRELVRQTDVAAWEAKGGLPRSALFHNVGGTFEDVSRRAGADLQLRGNGCVAADFNGDGDTDLYVTTAGYNVPTDTYDALLWNDGDGTFSEGAQAAGIDAPGWHAGAAAGDVNGDGRPDLFVASYTDPNALVQSPAGFPTNHLAVRDLLYLNEGTDANGYSIFRDVARAVGVERSKVGHGLGAVFTDYDGDGRLDLYVANDADPNQLYETSTTGGRPRIPPRGGGRP